MKHFVGIFTAVMIIIGTGWASYAHGVTYSVKQIGENTVNITLNADLQEGKGIEITSASKRGGKVLNIFYRIEDGAEGLNTMDVDLRTMLPPVRIILTNISEPDMPLFPDIKGIYAEEYIRHLHDCGAVGGFPDGTFKPERAVTRAEFMTMLLKALKISEKSELKSDFKDISKHWAKNIINTACSMKIINGFKDGTFRPNEKITAGQAAKIIDNLFKFRTVEAKDMPDLNPGHWAYMSIKNIVNADIIIPEDRLFETFKEDAQLSRADCAMILSRAVTTKN